MNKEFYDKYQKDLDCGSCPSLTNCISDTTPQCLLGTSFYLEDLVDQLKQQLAEKDTRIEELEGQFAYECECNKQLVDLQKQLAEKDKTIAKLEEDNGYILFEDGYDENGKEVHRQVYTTYQQAFNELVLEAKKLRQQLKEKDKEIETMKKDSDKNIDYLVEFASLIENEKDCNRMLKALDRVKSGNKYIIDKANQSKTEFAIQELEKVKAKVRDVSGALALCEVEVQIDQQINDLRGE